jgi:hypothetical protein
MDVLEEKKRRHGGLVLRPAAPIKLKMGYGGAWVAAR